MYVQHQILQRTAHACPSMRQLADIPRTTVNTCSFKERQEFRFQRNHIHAAGSSTFLGCSQGHTVKTRYKQRLWLPGNFAYADEIIPVRQNLGKFLLIQQDAKPKRLIPKSAS
jgi:hypothetical protein